MGGLKPIEAMTVEELAALMRAVATAVDDELPPLTPFAVLVFPQGGADPQYIGNCTRADIIHALRDCADRLEARNADERVGFADDHPGQVRPGAHPGPFDRMTPVELSTLMDQLANVVDAFLPPSTQFVVAASQDPDADPFIISNIDGRPETVRALEHAAAHLASPNAIPGPPPRRSGQGGPG